MADARVVDVDTGEPHLFSSYLLSQLSSLQSELLLKHEEEVAMLRAENQLLRDRLLQRENGNLDSSLTCEPVQSSPEADAAESMPSSELIKQTSPSSSQVCLEVTIVSAHNLRNMDIAVIGGAGGGLSDPYCICRLEGKPESEWRTHTVQDNLNPRWESAMKMASYEPEDNIEFILYDKDGKTDDFLGRARLRSDRFWPNGYEGTLSLRKEDQSIAPVDIGDINVKVSVLQEVKAESSGPTGDAKQRKASSDSKGPVKLHSQGSKMGMPENPTWIQRIVFTQTFELCSGGVILANTLVMALRLQYDAIDIGYDISMAKFLQPAKQTWPHALEVFYIIELSFTFIFITEWTVRAAALRSKAIFSGWMWFDGVVITVGAVDTFGSAALPVNPGMLRVLRLVRLVRLFKILKSMQAFDSLFLLQKAIAASMNAAVWSFGILIAVQLVVGLFLNQLMHTYLIEDHALDSKRRVFQFFGTFTGTMLTMFQITMSNWVQPCRALVDEVSDWFILFFIMYRCFFCFAVLKVIAAVFITETNRVLQHDDELTLMKLQREKAMFDTKVRRIVSGFAGETIGWNELEELAYNEDVKAHLSTFGFHPKDLEKLFWLIDDGSGKVAVDTFLAKVGGLKGPAKSIDVLTLMKLTHNVAEELTTGFAKMGYITPNDHNDAIEDRCCSILDRAKSLIVDNMDDGHEAERKIQIFRQFSP